MKTNKRNNKRFRKTKKHRMVGGVLSVMDPGYVFDGVNREWESICKKIEPINPDAKSLTDGEFKITYHKNDIYDNFVGGMLSIPTTLPIRIRVIL